MGRGASSHGPGLALLRWSAVGVDDPRLTLTRLERRVRLRPNPSQASGNLRALRLEGQQLGERIAVAYLRMSGDHDVKRLGKSSIPFDVLSREHAVEVKAGLCWNETNAQHWRCTFSAAKGKEARWLERQSQAVREAYFEEKRRAIMARKYAALATIQRVMPVVPLTLGLIIDLEGHAADVCWFPGWHLRIGWNSTTAKAGYLGTFQYVEAT